MPSKSAEHIILSRTVENITDHVSRGECHYLKRKEKSAKGSQEWRVTGVPQRLEGFLPLTVKEHPFLSRPSLS